MEYKITCKHCERYITTVSKSTILEDVPCPSCKAKSNYKVVFRTDYRPEIAHHKFVAQETPPKKLKKTTD